LPQEIPVQTRKQIASELLSDPSAESISSLKRKKTGKHNHSNAVAAASMANAIQSLVESFASSSNTVLMPISSPEHCQSAIQKLEGDGELDDLEQVDAISLFTRNTAATDSYLAISSKHIRTLFICREISQKP